jgi:hypothetical protein
MLSLFVLSRVDNHSFELVGTISKIDLEIHLVGPKTENYIFWAQK